MIIRNLDVERDWSNGALAEVTNMRNGVIELIHLDNRTNKVVGKFQSMFQAPTTVEGIFLLCLPMHQLFTKRKV